MTRTTRRRYLATSGALGLVALAGCADGGPGEDEPEQEPADDQPADEPPEDEDADEETPDDPDETDDQEPVEDVDHDDPDGEIEFVTPEDGAEVTSPVDVEADVDDFDLEPAGEDDVEDGTGHLHVIVDRDCVDPGYVIPHEEGYIHLEDGEAETELGLEPGEHELCLQMGDGIHDAYDLTDEITIEVVESDDGDGDQ